MPYGKANVRLATVQDARAIAQVHVESSKSTYRGIVSENLLDRLSVEDRTRFWNETLTKPEAPLVTLVGLREIRSLGFASMAVWVLALNPSRKFYEALGGKILAEQEIERGGESFVEIAYGWSDLSRFRA